MNTLAQARAPLAPPVEGEFWLHRSGDRSGPLTLAELRAQVVKWQILPEDEIEIIANSQRISGLELMKTVRMLEKNPELLYAEASVIITRESVLAKERVVRLADVERVDLLLPAAPRKKIISKMERILIWTTAVMLFWTLLAPIVAWYATRPDSKEEGLGIVHGILLRVAGGEDLLIMDGLGVLEPDSARRSELEKIKALLGSLLRRP